MRPNVTRHYLAMVAVAALLPMTVAGCTSASDQTPAPDASRVAAESPAAATPVAADQPFGAQCPELPASGDGSLQNIRQQEWFLAIASVPALSQLSVITNVVQVRNDLAIQQEITLFAPDNVALAAMSPTRATEILTDPGKAADLLRYHVVPGRLAPDALAGTHQTLSGQSLQVTGTGTSFTVDDRARVVCGNIQAGNATIYIIDRVLAPS